MKVLVVGAGGQLGGAVVAVLGRDSACEVRGARRGELDVTRPAAVQAAVRSLQPDWIVNCAAYNDVDQAEEEPAAALEVNDAAVGHLADAAQAAGARLLHLSTDYVFSGEWGAGSPRPYHEGDAPRPLGAYGRSKLAGEERLRAHAVRSAILRTSWLYGGSGRSFLRSILRLAAERKGSGKPLRVVADQWGTPTDVWSLAAQVHRCLHEGAEGLFHASAEGAATWCDFARAIVRRWRLGVGVEPIRQVDYGARAPRPPHAVLEKRRLLACGWHVLPHWTQGLELVFRRRDGLGPQGGGRASGP